MNAKHATTLGFLLVVGLIGGCDPDGTVIECDPGFYIPEGSETCIAIPVDGNVNVDGGPSDAGSDGNVGMDAGPCGMECTGGTPYCNDTTGACVACLDDTQCTDVGAAKCNLASGTCVACDASAQCMGITGAETCATSGDSAGSCVECTETETSACMMDHPCNPLTNACSVYEAGTVGVCQQCDSDANCTDTSSRCVALDFIATSRGGYCLRLVSAGCTRPYGGSIVNAVSLSGDTAADYCGIRQDLTTCEAVRAANGGSECSTTMMATECADAGGRCETIGAFTNQCTYSCDMSTECPSGVGCNSGYCGGMM